MDWLKKQRLPLDPPAAEVSAPPAPSAAAATRARSLLPRFQKTATDEVKPGSPNDLTEVRVKVSNSFTPSQPVTDVRMFSGRTKVFKDLIRGIEDHRMHVVIYGERGIGKTSVMNMLAEAASDARYLCVYVSCGANSSLDDVCRMLAAGIPLLFHQDFGPGSERSGREKTFADLLDGRPLSVHSAANILMQVTGTRVILLLDEFDRCESQTFKRDIAELMKNLSDRSGRVQLAIAGVAANLTELIAHIPSIQRNILALNVPKMTDDEVRTFVGNGESLCGVTFGEGASELVIASVGGMPHLASLICHHAALSALDGGNLTITTEDVEKAMDLALDELKGTVSKRAQLESAILKGYPMKLLVKLADALGPSTESFTEEDIHAAFGARQDGQRCAELVDSLSRDGVLVTRKDEELDARYHLVELGALAYLRLLYSRAAARTVRRRSKPALA